MGTSSPFGGPKGTGSLLPPWAEPAAEDVSSQPLDSGGNAESASENNKPSQENASTARQQDNQDNTVPSVSWGDAKNTFTRYVGSVNRSSGRTGGSRGAFSSFVKAQGGSRRATRASSSGRSTTQRVGQVFSSIISKGAEAAIKDIGLAEFVGVDAQTLLSKLVDYIAPVGVLLEESVARSAALDLLAELFERYNVEEKGLAALDSLTPDILKSVLLSYVGKYVYTRVLEVLSKNSEHHPVETLIRVERDIKDYITATVKYDFKQVDVLKIDWEGTQGRDMVNRIYEEAYTLLEKSL